MNQIILLGIYLRIYIKLTDNLKHLKHLRQQAIKTFKLLIQRIK